SSPWCRAAESSGCGLCPTSAALVVPARPVAPSTPPGIMNLPSRRSVLGNSVSEAPTSGRALLISRLIRRSGHRVMWCPLLAPNRLVLVDRNQGDLAPVVDVGDLDLDLIADVELVLNLLDPAVAADIRDVQQTVAPRQQGDEGTEGGGLHNRAKEAVPNLRLLRIGDRIDLLDRSLGGLAAHGGDEHGAVVLDGDVGAGLLRDLVDGLA